MGNKDKTWDESAATSNDREQESRDTALARTIALAVAEAFAKQKAEETKLITGDLHKANGEDTGTI